MARRRRTGKRDLGKWLLGGAAALAALLFFEKRSQAAGGGGFLNVGGGAAGGSGQAGGASGTQSASGGGSGLLTSYEFKDMTTLNINVDPQSLKQGDQVLVELQKPGVDHGDGFGATINGPVQADGSIEVIVTGPVTASDIIAQFPLGSSASVPFTSIMPGG